MRRGLGNISWRGGPPMPLARTGSSDSLSGSRGSGTPPVAGGEEGGGGGGGGGGAWKRGMQLPPSKNFPTAGGPREFGRAPPRRGGSAEDVIEAVGLKR